MNRNDINIAYVLDLYKSNGYILKDGVYQLNVFGIRSLGGFTDTFNDFVCGLRMNHGNSWECFVFAATTDPGSYWMQNPMNVDGTAIVKAGQYTDSHKVGFHRGEYRALVQNKPITCWRDKNRDLAYDHEHTTTGLYGINIHHASPDHTSTKNYNWSAGCQVLADPKEFTTLMGLVDDNIAKGYGEVFTYTLFEEKPKG